MQKFTPCLWYDDKAEEAAKFYTSIFKNSGVKHVAYYGDAGSQAAGRQRGSVMTVAFQLDGQDFLGLNGGPVFQFSPAISFIVNCEDQAEVDRMWEKLSEGGRKDQCGWLQDKYGVSWQIVPRALGQMMQDKDARKSENVMAALMKMNKISIRELEEAYAQE